MTTIFTLLFIEGSPHVAVDPQGQSQPNTHTTRMDLYWFLVTCSAVGLFDSLNNTFASQLDPMQKKKKKKED